MYLDNRDGTYKVTLKGNWNQFAGKPDFRRIGKETRAAFPDDDVGVFLRFVCQQCDEGLCQVPNVCFIVLAPVTIAVLGAVAPQNGAERFCVKVSACELQMRILRTGTQA